MISRQLHLPYTAAQLYALVNDVARYPEFVPWCTQATVYVADPQYMRAELKIAWQGITQSFMTENKLVENQSISMNLVQGALKNLQGAWHFEPRPLGGCDVQLTISLGFKNRLFELLFAKVMDRTLNHLVEAFCARAQVLYG